MKKIITISREFGSGGHDIGMEVAKRLDIPFYDHETQIRQLQRVDLQRNLQRNTVSTALFLLYYSEHRHHLTVIIMQMIHRIRFSRFSVESLQSLHRKAHVLSLEDVRITFQSRQISTVLMCLSEPISRREWRMYLTESILRRRTG